MKRALNIAVVAGLLLAASTAPQQRAAAAVHTMYASHDLSAISWTGPTAAAPTAVVAVDYNTTMNATGWDQIAVTPNATLLEANASAAYYAAGYAEAYLTADRIWMQFVNSGRGMYESMNADALNWVSRHMAYLSNTARYNPLGAPDVTNGQDEAIVEKEAFRAQVGKFMRQFRGMADGFNAAVAAGQCDAPGCVSMTDAQMFVMSFQDEVYDVNQAIAANVTMTAGLKVELAKPIESHCSALIKLIPAANDVAIGHTTWGGFGTMLRQYKTYNFETSVVMSGYPGSISSVDDWYMTGNQLAVTETTLNQLNGTLSALYVVPETVSEFIRVMAANVLAGSAKTWARLFLMENSGTYCNQYMVLDMNLLLPSNGTAVAAGLPADFFWVVEQMPGPYSVAQDMTQVLQTQGHWPSYNRAYFASVNEIGGVAAFAAQYGNYYTYDKYVRAVQFAKYQGGVDDVSSLARLLRYNNYQNDNTSLWTAMGYPDTCDPVNNPVLAIASRRDLTRADANFSCIGQGVITDVSMLVDGAIDVKATSFQMMVGGNFSSSASSLHATPGAPAGPRHRQYQSVIQSGPSHEFLPPFQWSTSAAAGTQSHVGQPDKWDFGYMLTLTPATSHQAVDNLPTGAITGPSDKWPVVLGVLAGVVVVVACVFVLRRFMDGSRSTSDKQYMAVP